MKNIFSILLLMIMITALGTAQTEPLDTDSDGKREVSTLDHLLWISENSSGWGYSYEQTADIDAAVTSSWNSGDGWLPIGDGSTTFTGSYDGQGYTISNLHASNGYYKGFFGALFGATVSNVGITNVNISGIQYLGGLAGYADGATSINNCYSSGSVNGSGSYVGGLVGQFRMESTITNSYSSCTVATTSGNQAAGGLVGEIWSNCIVSKCYATGNVTGDQGVGGFVGQIGEDQIGDSYSSGNVSRVSGSSQDNLGGFCGWNINYVTIQNSYSTGSVTYTGSTNPTDKGFIGIDDAGSPGTYSNNFWDTQSSNQSTASGAMGKTTTEMKTQSTFTEWDFSGTWEIVGGDGVNYPRLLTNPDPALPVELVSFTAAAHHFKVELYWKTATEVNNHGFEVERRLIHESRFTNQDSGIDPSNLNPEPSNGEWLHIGFVEGAGTSNAPKEYSYSDGKISAGKYEYRLKQIDLNGLFKYSHSVEVSFMKPAEFSLHQNYPNPFNPTTTIEFTLAEDGMTTLKIFDILGREVATLINEEIKAGVLHQATFDASQLSTGLYFYRLESNKNAAVNKFILMK